MGDETASGRSAQNDAVEVDAATLAALRREVGSLRRDRMDRQSRLHIRPSIERAIAVAERETDALTSEAVEKVRDWIERASAQLQDWWETADSIRLRLARLEANGFVVDEIPHGSKLLAALAEEAGVRARSAEMLATGSSLRPPDVLVPVIPPLPRATELRRIVEEARAHMRERDVQARRKRVTKNDRRDVDAR